MRRLDPDGPRRLLLMPGVARVLAALAAPGEESRLVGGCVRDLLLDRRPKDFEVATSARPEEVRELFRNSRIIGRRFRLVHVLFQGGKVIEVATFRRNPKEDTDDGSELLIRSDNVFGAAHEDAVRRDFRFNALFYDIEERHLDAASELAPGREGPTISPLGKAGWVAVRVMVPRAGSQRLMDELYSIGARAILLTDIHACRL